MAKETIGYVRMEWTCPKCSTKNPGPQRFCSSCGSPQPEEVKFEQQAQAELIKEEAEIARAKAGPDVHCYYCGSRNPPGTQTCSQCGADLSQATSRSVGQVVGVYKAGPAPKITCPACGSPNEPTAPKCAQCGASLVQPKPEPAAPAVVAAKKSGSAGLFGGIGLVIVLLLCIGGAIAFFTFANRTEDMTGRVQEVNWTRSIAIQGLVPVTYEDWRDEIPAGVVVGGCTQKPHHIQDEPASNASKICGTPYTVDAGSGYGEVVQDCQYQVYADWCEYTVEEWRNVDQIVLDGQNLNPVWPVASLGLDQREGGRDETYKVVFATEQGAYTYTTGDPADFARFQPGSQWVLEINGFGGVVSAKPVQ